MKTKIKLREFGNKKTPCGLNAIVYKMLLGLVRVNSELFFARRNRPHLRGHTC